MYRFPAVTERVERLRKRYRDELPSFDSERVRLLTEYYQESEYEVLVIRRAKAMHRILFGMPVRIEPEELLVGYTGKYYKGSMLFPEYTDIDWIPRELSSGKFDRRTMAEARCHMNAEDREYLCSVAPYWHDHSVPAMTRAEMPEGTADVCSSGVLPYGRSNRNSYPACRTI